MTDGAKKEQKKALKKIKTTIQKTGSRLAAAGTAAASRQQRKKSHTEKVGESRSPKQMTKDAKKAQKKATKEAGKGFKDSFKDTACSVKSAGKTLVNATGINGKQKKEQAVDKIYGITRGIGTTIAHPIRSAKEIASGIKKKAKEKGESYVGGYILGELTQTAATAGVAAAAGKGLKGAKAAKKRGKHITVTSTLGKEIDVTPSAKHSQVRNNPGVYGEANSSVDIVDANGKIKTRRWYDSEGKAYRDVDMSNHGNSKEHSEVPHEHIWEYNGGKAKSLQIKSQG